jgi:hypothetical protein
VCIQRPKLFNLFPVFRLDSVKNSVEFQEKAHGTEGRYLLYPFLVARKLIPWCALLSEPEYPSVATAIVPVVRPNLITAIECYEHTYISGGVWGTVSLLVHSKEIG